MTDVATSVEIPTRRQCKKHKEIIGSLISAVVLLTFLIVAIALAFVFSRSKTHKTKPAQERSENKQEKSNYSTDENFRMSSLSGYPFMAALYSEKPNVLLCSCAIITKHHLLTAANCFSVLFPRLLVRTGSPLWNERGNVYQVQDVIIHKNYSAINFENNLAIVKVNKTMSFSATTNSAKMEVNADLKEGNTIVMGWGRLGLTVDL